MPTRSLTCLMLAGLCLMLTPDLASAQSAGSHAAHGDRSGDVFIGHRAVIQRYAGWGWIKEEGRNWNRARWAIIQEEPGVRMAPGRFLKHPDDDNDFQYRLYGEWASEKAYEPNFDLFIPVFKIKGFERIGKAERPNLQPPRPTNSKIKSRYGERGANLSD